MHISDYNHQDGDTNPVYKKKVEKKSSSWNQKWKQQKIKIRTI